MVHKPGFNLKTRQLIGYGIDHLGRHINSIQHLIQVCFGPLQLAATLNIELGKGASIAETPQLEATDSCDRIEGIAANYSCTYEFKGGLLDIHIRQRQDVIAGP